MIEAKCIRFNEFGNPRDVLRVEDKIIQRPMNGEILVRMITRPINPSDLIPIRGAYSHRISLPSIPGHEGVGVVEEIGSSVSIDMLGQRVLPLRGEGTWQEIVRTSAAFAVPVPDSIDDYTAAQLYINPLTAWLICTDILNLREGDVVLVNACGSSIGRIFAQLAKRLGFRLIAVTRNPIYTEELLRLGASDVIHSSEQKSIRHTVMELTNGSGANAAIDSVGGSSGTDLAFSVRADGILLSIGLLSGIPLNAAEIARDTKANMKMFHLRHWNERVSIQSWHASLNQVIELVKDRKLKLMSPNSHYGLIEVKDAILKAEKSPSMGKIFLNSC